MTLQKPLHISPQGGSIICLEGIMGRIFKACFSNKCTYTKSLYSAKTYLESFEKNMPRLLPSVRIINPISPQRQTTLKWNTDGSLSSVDMARILSRLNKASLTECELSCECNY